jgi:hypothetical protein
MGIKRWPFTHLFGPAASTTSGPALTLPTSSSDLGGDCRWPLWPLWAAAAATETATDTSYVALEVCPHFLPSLHLFPSTELSPLGIQGQHAGTRTLRGRLPTTAATVGDVRLSGDDWRRLRPLDARAEHVEFPLLSLLLHRSLRLRRRRRWRRRKTRAPRASFCRPPTFPLLRPGSTSGSLRSNPRPDRPHKT